MHNCSPKINRISLVRHCLLARIAVGSTTVWMGLGPTRGLAPWCLASKALGTGDYFRINSLLRGIFCFVTECECDRSLGDWRWDTNRYRCPKVIDVSPTSMRTSVEKYSNVSELNLAQILKWSHKICPFFLFSTLAVDVQKILPFLENPAH